MHIEIETTDLPEAQPLLHPCPRCDDPALSVFAFHVHCDACDYTEMLDFPWGSEDFEVDFLSLDKLDDLEQLDSWDVA